MTGLNHVLAGVTIAITVRHPLLAPLFALVSHFILDMIPHFGGPAWFERWGKPLFIMTILDGTVCSLIIILGIICFPQFWLLILVCAAAATIPDWLWIFHYKYGVKHRFFDFHFAIQRYERPWGVYIEVAFMLLVTSVLWNYWVFSR